MTVILAYKQLLIILFKHFEINIVSSLFFLTYYK